nr:Chain A, SGMGGIT segment 58-64 from the low complexity domain of Keratin-8 [Homo sapiens]7K3C_B Chain B, SGMGGIT segment 58-64 from the low complexity domain of Keratin-8 [Homo sapiens]
SGMGGIT